MYTVVVAVSADVVSVTVAICETDVVAIGTVRVLCVGEAALVAALHMLYCALDTPGLAGAQSCLRHMYASSPRVKPAELYS